MDPDDLSISAPESLYKSFGRSLHHERSRLIKLIESTIVAYIALWKRFLSVINMFDIFNFINLWPFTPLIIELSSSYLEWYVPFSSVAPTKFTLSITNSTILGSSLINLLVLFSPIALLEYINDYIYCSLILPLLSKWLCE